MKKLIIGHRLLEKKLESFLVDYCRFLVNPGKVYWYLKGTDLVRMVGEIYVSRPHLLAVSSFLPDSTEDRNQDKLFAIQECGAENIICTGFLARALAPAEIELINMPKYSRMKFIIDNRDSIKLDLMLQSILVFDRDDVVFTESCSNLSQICNTSEVYEPGC